MNRDSLRQALRAHVLRLRRQDGAAVSCTVDELLCQVDGVLSADKPDYGFGEALAMLQCILNGGSAAATASNTPASVPSTMTPSMPAMPHRRGSIGSSGSIGEIIDAEALVSRHALKTVI